MGLEPTQDAIDAVDLDRAPLAVDAALRKVRLVTALLVAVRLITAHTMPVWQIATLIVAFLTVNLIARASREDSASTRTALGIVQLSADAFVVLLVTCLQHSSADAADWAILVLPVIEGAILFQIRGAVVTWAAIAVGYAGWALFLNHDLTAAVVAQRLGIVLLVALPSSFLAENLVAEIAAHRRGRLEAERRGSLLRAAAFSGRRSTTLDVDEILDVLRDTVAEMGFAEPQVFELVGDAPVGLMARPVRQSRDVLAIPPGDQRLLGADRARHAGASILWPPAGDSGTGVSKVFAVPVTSTETGDIVLTARWPGPGLPPESQTESIELFAAQAGASLRNAQVYRELQTLKDRLAHEASHDALTDLPNRRRFHEQLERMCSRGRAGDTLAVLFLDLDGFKHVNDHFGHDVGNELLVTVAARLLSCVRPGDIVARMGGDEFVIMLTRIENAAPAIEVADRVCALLADPFDFKAGEVRISTSVGIALAPGDTADPGDLVRRADVAMYRAKSQGKAGWAMDPGSLSPSS